MSDYHMSNDDLGDLYILLHNYIKYYDCNEQYLDLLLEIGATYNRQFRSQPDSNTTSSVIKKSHAGRKPISVQAQTERIWKYHMDGKTMREIAALESCSVGHVHKLIHEHQD